MTATVRYSYRLLASDNSSLVLFTYDFNTLTDGSLVTEYPVLTLDSQPAVVVDHSHI